MKKLPPSLASHLAERESTGRHPAWIGIGPDLRIVEAHGEFEHYGLEGVKAGGDPLTWLPCLQGSLPPGSLARVLPLISLGSGRTADVHVVGESELTWALLIDRTSEAREKQLIMQAVNEQSLQIGALKKQKLARLLPALDLLVLVKQEDDTFTVLGDAPAWAQELAAGSEALELEEVFPFLESFLPEAEEVWLNAAPPARSGVWVQEIGKSELAFEATAARPADDLFVLIVELRLSEVAERQALVQKARDGALQHRRLLKETEKKEILLHCIVHDLKQPLSVIKGSLGLIGSLPEAEAEKLIGVASNQVDRQERMIRNVLDVFASDLAELDPAAHATSARTDLLGCAKSAVEDFQPAFRERGLGLGLEFEASVRGCQVRGERGRLERVFANLLENALKHTPPPGEASVSLGREGDVARVSVQNDGAEVPEELRERLFQRFSRDVHGGGAGLGLYYCAMTLERWGGSIRYEPHTGGGARFIFELPIVEEELTQS